MDFDWSIALRYRDALLGGLQITLQVSVLGIIGGTLLGIVVAAVRATPGLFFQRLAATYIEIVRNIPLIVKIFYFYYVVGFDAFIAGLVGLSIHQSGYISDVITSGLRSIPREQTESARVLGHNYPQTFAYVLLPQLLRITIPPMTSQYIEVVKNSSIVMFLGITELTWQTQQIEFETARGYVAAGVATLLYLSIALTISALMSLAAWKWRRAI
jgi:polar amino acid transport system permease protein